VVAINWPSAAGGDCRSWSAGSGEIAQERRRAHAEEVEGGKRIPLPALVGPGEQLAQHLQALRGLCGEQVDLGADAAGVESAEAQVRDTAAEVALQAEFDVGRRVPLQHAEGPVAQVGRHPLAELDPFRDGDVDALVDLRGRVPRGGHEVGKDVGRGPVIPGVELQEAREELVVRDLPLLDEEPTGIEDDVHAPAVVQVANVVEAAAVTKEGRDDAALEGAFAFPLVLPKADEVAQVVGGVRERGNKRQGPGRQDRQVPLEQRPEFAGTAAGGSAHEPQGFVERVGRQVGRAGESQEPDVCPTALLDGGGDEAPRDSSATERGVGGDLVDGRRTVAPLVKAHEADNARPGRRHDQLPAPDAVRVSLARVEAQLIAVQVRERLDRIDQRQTRRLADNDRCHGRLAESRARLPLCGWPPFE
jgi:hypothetical protein